MTLKGAKALAQAQLVLYDSLVHQEVLKMAHADAMLVCVGKRAGQTSTPQILIHDWIERGARQGLRIVRLKGGDPMVFGRARHLLRDFSRRIGWHSAHASRRGLFGLARHCHGT
jgi:siroheme synthase